MAPSVRTTVNVLSFLMTAAILGILIYVVVNLKSFLQRGLDLGLAVVESRRNQIQKSINTFTADTAESALKNEKIQSALNKTTIDILEDKGVNEAMGDMANNVIEQTNPTMKKTMADAIASDEVSTAMTDQINKSIKAANWPPNSM